MGRVGNINLKPACLEKRQEGTAETGGIGSASLDSMSRKKGQGISAFFKC